MFHKAKTVTPLSDYRLLVHFANGADKEYDMKPLFDRYPVFLELKETPGLFEQARADVGGYGIVWNEDIDIDTEEVYQNGRDVETPFSGLISFSEAIGTITTFESETIIPIGLQSFMLADSRGRLFLKTVVL